MWEFSHNQSYNTYAEAEGYFTTVFKQPGLEIKRLSAQKYV